MIVFVVIAIFIISVLLLYNQSILFYLVFTLVVAIGEYGTDYSKVYSVSRGSSNPERNESVVQMVFRHMGYGIKQPLEQIQ